MALNIQAGLVFFPALYMGIVIGLYELIAIHQDVHFRGSHWFGHGLHAVLIGIIGVFAVFNIDFVMQSLPVLQNIPLINNEWVFRGVLFLILNIKIHFTSMAVHGGQLASRGMGEHWTHTTIVTLLIVTSDYIWPVIEGFLGFLPGVGV